MAEAPRSKAPRQKGQRHECVSPRDRLARRRRSRAHRTQRLPRAPLDPLRTENNPGPEHVSGPGQFPSVLRCAEFPDVV